MKKDVNIVNKKVKFEYTFIRTLNAGIKLFGSEIKPIRGGKISMVNSYCYFNGNELFMKNVVINGNDNAFSHDPNRDKKLLLKKRELIKLKNELINGLSIVPYRIYLNDRNILKVEIVLVKGKNVSDKRETIKKRDIEREINKIFKK